MKALLAMLMVATLLFAGGIQAFAADEGRVSDEPNELVPYILQQ